MEASKHQGFYQHVTLFQGVGLLACAESFRPKNGLESPDAKRTAWQPRAPNVCVPQATTRDFACCFGSNCQSRTSCNQHRIGATYAPGPNARLACEGMQLACPPPASSAGPAKLQLHQLSSTLFGQSLIRRGAEAMNVHNLCRASRGVGKCRTRDRCKLECSR